MGLFGQVGGVNTEKERKKKICSLYFTWGRKCLCTARLYKTCVNDFFHYAALFPVLFRWNLWWVFLFTFQLHVLMSLLLSWQPSNAPLPRHILKQHRIRVTSDYKNQRACITFYFCTQIEWLPCQRLPQTTNGEKTQKSSENQLLLSSVTEERTDVQDLKPLCENVLPALSVITGFWCSIIKPTSRWPLGRICVCIKDSVCLRIIFHYVQRSLSTNIWAFIGLASTAYWQ